jgi:hypothetical protein
MKQEEVQELLKKPAVLAIIMAIGLKTKNKRLRRACKETVREVIWKTRR